MRYVYSLLITFGILGVIAADDFCRQRVVTYNAHQVQQVQHHAYQPGYNFQPNYQALYYYDVDSYYRDKLLLDAIELRILKAVQSKPQYIPIPTQQVQPVQQENLRPLVEELLKSMQSSQQIEASVKVNGKTVTQSSGSGGSNLPPGEQLPAPGATQNNSSAGSVPDGLQALVDNKCIRCHNGGNNMDLRNLAALTSIQKFDAWERVNSGNMPKNGTPLPDNEEKLFRKLATSSIR